MLDRDIGAAKARPWELAAGTCDIGGRGQDSCNESKHPISQELCKPQNRLENVPRTLRQWRLKQIQFPTSAQSRDCLPKGLGLGLCRLLQRPLLQTRASENQSPEHSPLPGAGAGVFSVLGTGVTPGNDTHKSLSSLQRKWGQLSKSKTES